MTTFAGPSTSTREGWLHAEPADDGKTAGHAVARHGRWPEVAGARQGCQRAELPGTTVSAGRSTMGLAREPGAGTETESGQAARTCLRGRHRLPGCAWTG